MWNAGEMRDYRCYFLNGLGKIIDVLELHSADDEAALSRARHQFIQQAEAAGYEVWQRARLVHRETPERPVAFG